MLRRHPLFDEIDASLAAFMPRDPVHVVGRWMSATSRTYQAEEHSGTGTGPFRDVIDTRWEGTLSCPTPMAGIAFMAIGTELLWAKSTPAAPTLPVIVSFHAYAEYSAERATFAAGMGGARLPGVSVACHADVVEDCTLGQTRLSTGCVEELAHVDNVGFFALLMPQQLLKVGRHRLWRVREKFASSLPPQIREILTRRRAGTIPLQRTVA
jgi:hypothetical protein